MIRKTALQIGAVASFGLIVWSGYVVVSHVKQMQKIAALTLQSSVIQAEISSVEKDLTDMEAGQRGYLLTNNPSYLQPYTEATSRIAADFANLRASLANRGDHERSLASQVESLANSNQLEMERSIRLRQQGYRRRAFKLVDSNEGMSNARKHLSSLSFTESSRIANIETDRNAGLRQVLKETIIANLALLALVACLFVLVRYHGRVLEQEAAQSVQQLASQDSQLARFMSVLSSEARSKTSAIEANIRLLLQEYGGFLPRHAHKCAEQIREASAQLEQLRQDLVGDSCSSNDEKPTYQAVA
ncbi:MAG TPA: CHASE3 domain-containing protein [Terriglobales bacterium]|jgi:CHASE3 domain sensor protein|nr:CHASE3 domain-containing protein [Terriglobales bacterium]